MVYTNDFETVYSHYPLKKGKFQAQKTWSKLKQDGQLPEPDVMIKAIADQKKERSYLRNQNKFCAPWKHFSTWLNAGCWTDECFYKDEPRPVARVSSVENLHRAYNILVNVSEARFKEFCEGVRMDPEDRERVWNKYNMAFNVKQLAARAVKGV